MWRREGGRREVVPKEAGGTQMGRAGAASSADGLFSEQKGATEREQAWPVGE